MNSESRSNLGKTLSATESEDKNNEKLNFILEKLDSKIEALVKNKERYEKAMQDATQLYMNKMSALHGKNDPERDILFDSYNSKNKEFMLKINRCESKKRKLEREREKIAASGKVSNISYWVEKGSEKIAKLVDFKLDQGDDSVELVSTPKISSPCKDNSIISLNELKTHVTSTFKCSSLQSNESDSLQRNHNLGNSLESGKGVAVEHSDVGGTLLMILNYLETYSEKIDRLEKDIIRRDKEINSKIESTLEEYKSFVINTVYESEKEIYTNSDQALSRLSDSLELRLTKIESMLESLNDDKTRVVNSSGQQVCVKLANILVTVLTTLVMVISSFADAVIRLNANVKLAMLFVLLLYISTKTVWPIFFELF